MKKVLLLFLFSWLFCTACNMSEKKADPGEQHHRINGDSKYGGVLRLSETDAYQTLYPHDIIDLVSTTVAYQIYEGLVKFDTKDLSVIPSIAEKWEVDTSSLVYTFHLKKGVFFHDNPCFPGNKGREVKAGDFKYSFELLCTSSSPGSASMLIDIIKGAKQYQQKIRKKQTDTGIPGVKVIDDYTLQVSLEEPSNSFLQILASPGAFVVAKEAFEKYGPEIKVGTGPFVFSETNKSPDRIVLQRNQAYHSKDSLGNPLPYLDSVIITYSATKSKELEAFKRGEIDIIFGLPSEAVKEIVEKGISGFEGKTPKYILDRSSDMFTQYYELNLTRPPFNKLKVRQAFSYAINRNKIIDEVLKGEAYGPGIYGFTPPAFKEYDITNIKGYQHDPKKAKQLLAEAGYPKGKNFPKTTIQLNPGGAKYSNVVLEVQKQLREVLNINLNVELVTLKEKVENAKFAKSEIFRSGWCADFPSPESFLWVFYGVTVPSSLTEASFPNITRYKNKEYDALFEAGKKAKTKAESYAYFLKAEQTMMDDAPIIVLWYDEAYRLVQTRVKNFPLNPMRYYDFSAVYLKELSKDTVLEAKSARNKD